MNEADTRAELIDPQLKDAGWVSGGDVRVLREYAINAGEIRAGGIRCGQLWADYILVYKNRNLAVIEAKSDELDVSEGVAQAKLYAQKLNIATSYAANGKKIYQICHNTGDEKLVDRFPTPDELWQKTFADCNEWLEKFNAVPLANAPNKQPRYYQEIAVNKTMEAVANNKNRILLTLATGTGKTFIAFQIAWKLFQSRWNMQKDGRRQPRILFLTDRNILANQAYLDFGVFAEDALVRINPGGIRREGEVPTNGSVFFTIFQTFMSGDEPYFDDYERDFFDLVIIDECHRGGANEESRWRGILDHFNHAVHLGLTATPKRRDNVDTYQYFGEPVYTYSLAEGIQDGFLTPFKVKRIQTTIDEYMYASDDDVLAGEVERDRVYTESDFNKIIEIEARERKRVQLMLANINANEKTLVFCASQAHAAKVRDLINQESENTAVDYCVRVTSDEGAIGDDYLRQFQDNEKLLPTILTTSHKLSTGVDARNVRNIVLMRSIKSMIEFKQIIGRGTRLFEGKCYFTIIDFVKAYSLFGDAEWDGEPMEPVAQMEDIDAPDDNGERDNKDKSVIQNIERPQKIKIRLPDGKEREIESMLSNHFFIGGQLVGPQEFVQRVFNQLQLPEIFGDEQELRKIWANPNTRNKLLKQIEAAGCTKEDLVKLQELINAENSDLFDVLEHVAYQKPPISREERVRMAESNIYADLTLTPDQRDFIQFVLGNYIKDGIDELDIANLSTLIHAKYGSMDEGMGVLGKLTEIKGVFIDFQRYLYVPKAANG